MATRVTTYNPADVQVSVAGNIISGYAPGRMVEYRPDAPVWTDALGVDNEAVRWALSNPMATLSLILAQSSTSNFVLSALLNLDRITGAQIAPVLVQDMSGDGLPTSIIAKLGWLNTQPPLLWGANAGVRQWDLRLVLVAHDIHGLDQDEVITL